MGSGVDRNCEIVSEGGRNQISFILLLLDKLIQNLQCPIPLVQRLVSDKFYTKSSRLAIAYLSSSEASA